MEVEELRIGCHVEDGLQRRCRVTELTCYTVGCDYGDDWCEIICDKVYPIPITPELLTEFGFEKIDFHGQDVFRKLYKDIPLGKMYYILSYNSNAEAWDFTVHTTATTVKYLHELESMVYHATKRELISE